jgi:integrase
MEVTRVISPGLFPAPTPAPAAQAAFEAALSAFAAENALTARPPQVRRNLAAVRHFWTAAGGPELHAIDRQAILDYLTSLLTKTVGPKTLRNHLGALGRFCQWLKDRGILPDNPAHTIRLPGLHRPPPHFLNDQEVAQAIKLARAHRIEMEVILALHTGLRMGELRRMRWADVDFTAKLLTVWNPEPQSKANRFRVVSLNSVAIQALQTQHRLADGSDYVFPGRLAKGKGCRNGPRGVEWWATVLQPLQKVIPTFQRLQVGSTGRGWHTLRHTFASRLLQRCGGNILPDLQKMLGHASIQTTMIYAHLAEGFNPAVEKLC